MAAKKKTVEGVSARQPGERQGEGRLGRVEKQQKKERKVPVGQVQRGIKPGDVDVQTGKPKTSRFGRLKAFATRKERPTRPPRTMGERLGSIGRTAQRTFPAEKGTRPGGILDIEALRRETAGPMGKTQKPRTPPPGRALSLEEKKRKGMRVTAADVPGSGEEAGRGTAIPEITREEGGKGLGKFRGRGYKPPPPKKKPPRKAKAKPKPKPKKKWWERALEVTKELSAEAQRDAAKYEERKAGKRKDVKKVQKKIEKLPPKPKRKKPKPTKPKATKPKATQPPPTRTGGPKRVEKFVTKPPPVPEDQAERAKGITERLMKRRTEQERKARERAEKRR